MKAQKILPLFSPIATNIHVSALKGQKVALDGHGFLRRGVYALDYAEDFKKGDEVVSLTESIMSYVKMLKQHKVTLIVVFDGLPLPLKTDTDIDRSTKRSKAMVNAEESYKRGDMVEANKFYHQAFFIDHDMLRQVINNVREKGVQCIVAPYEVEAQLAYLINTNKVDTVMAPDADHLAFGCSKVIFNIDRQGNGKQIRFRDIFLQHGHLNSSTFRHACILSGCEYLPSVRGVDLEYAVNLFSQRSNINGVIDLITSKRPRDFPQDYHEKFQQAELGFLYQWVYDPDLRTYVRLNPVPASVSHAELLPLGRKPTSKDISFLGINRIVLQPRSPRFQRPLSGNPSPVASSSATSSSLLYRLSQGLVLRPLRAATGTKRKENDDVEENDRQKKHKSSHRQTGNTPLQGLSAPHVSSSEPTRNQTSPQSLHSSREASNPNDAHRPKAKFFKAKIPAKRRILRTLSSSGCAPQKRTKTL